MQLKHYFYLLPELPFGVHLDSMMGGAACLMAYRLSAVIFAEAPWSVLTEDRGFLWRRTQKEELTNRRGSRVVSGWFREEDRIIFLEPAASMQAAGSWVKFEMDQENWPRTQERAYFFHMYWCYQKNWVRRACSCGSVGRALVSYSKITKWLSNPKVASSILAGSMIFFFIRQ